MKALSLFCTVLLVTISLSAKANFERVSSSECALKFGENITAVNAVNAEKFVNLARAWDAYISFRKAMDVIRKLPAANQTHKMTFSESISYSWFVLGDTFLIFSAVEPQIAGEINKACSFIDQ